MKVESEARLMAKALVSYVSDVRTIRQLIINEHGHSPSPQAIAALRGSWLRQQAAAKKTPYVDPRHNTEYGDTTQRIMTTLERANEVFVTALKTGRGPNRFIWEHNSQVGQGGSNFADQRERVARLQAAAQTVPSYVSRDPCTYCGVRADVGCRHR